MKLCKKLIPLLLCCLMALSLLSACGGGQRTEAPVSGSPVSSSPVQSAGEANPGEVPVQTGVPDLETMDDNGSGEEYAPLAPQPPGISAEQSEEERQPENETEAPDTDPTPPPAQEAPGEAPKPSEAMPGDAAEETAEHEEERTEMKMTIQIGTNTFAATLESNAAADTLAEMLKSGPVTLQMRDYAGFEKVGDLGTGLPASDSQTTTQPGDIVLYQGNQIVLFYGSNAWSYTRLGKIDDLTGWAEALGSGDVAVTFSLGG